MPVFVFVDMRRVVAPASFQTDRGAGKWLWLALALALDPIPRRVGLLGW
jgi:hypothetical protein